jgi:hypothetical protein
LVRLTALVVVVAVALAMAPVDAAGDEARFQLGGGVDFSLLGSYGVAEGLGRSPAGDDLGPGTLGVFLVGDALVAPALRLGLEAGIALGGLVRTDEKYFGGQSDVGSTSTVWAAARLGWTAVASRAVHLRVGARLALERLSEASGAGSVRLDAIAAGPAVALVYRGLAAELHGEVHAPFRGQIGDDSGDPDGAFLSAGLRLAYLFDLP